MYTKYWSTAEENAQEQCDMIDWPRGNKTFFMLNSTEHEISIAHKNLNIDK